MDDKVTLFIVRAGATASGFGLAGLAWATNRWAMRTSYPAPLFFWVAAALALVAWGVSTHRRSRQERHGRQVWQVFTRSTLAVATVLLGASGFLAGFSDPSDVAFRAAMRSDLRTLMSAEDEFFADSGAFTSDLVSLSATLGRGSSGVLGPEFSLTGDGWTASVSHTSGLQTCAIFVGTTPLAPATVEREPACTSPRYPFPLGGSLLALAIVGAGAGLAGLATLVGRRRVDS